MFPEIAGRLDCTQKVICSLIAVTETSLSTAIQRPISEIKENKVGKRLLSLLYVVETLARDQSLTPAVILKVLVTPCYWQEDDTYLDVVSAIQQSTIPNNLLIPIADAAADRRWFVFSDIERTASPMNWSKRSETRY